MSWNCTTACLLREGVHFHSFPHLVLPLSHTAVEGGEVVSQLFFELYKPIPMACKVWILQERSSRRDEGLAVFQVNLQRCVQSTSGDVHTPAVPCGVTDLR